MAFTLYLTYLPLTVFLTQNNLVSHYVIIEIDL